MRYGWIRLLPAGLVAALAITFSVPAEAADPGNRVELTVTSKGFSPTPVKVKQGEPLTLVVTRTTDKTCAKEIVIPSEGINVPLPLNQPVEVRFTPKKSGAIKYGCAMDQMVAGVLVIE